MITILERARRYVVKCPPAISGQGGHNAAFHVAAVLVHGFALSEGDALRLMQEWNTKCLPPWSEAELFHKVKSARAAQHGEAYGYLAGSVGEQRTSQERGTRPVPPKPKFRPMVLKRVAAKAPVANVGEFIKSQSPVTVGAQDTASVLRWLYPRTSREKVLVFSEMRSQGQMLWEAERSDGVQAKDLPQGSEGVWFLPQPVTGLYYPNPRAGGKESRRSEEAVTAWRYLVLESDKAEGEDWLRCLIQMPLRIMSICESGRRSIHALVRVDASSKADWDAKVSEVKPVLVTLGADAGALSAVRLTRLPQAMRGARKQTLLYLNPRPDGTPILEQKSPSKGYQ